MRPNNLNKKGLSMTQAQSISNLIYQAARLIDNQLNSTNNSHRTINIGGNVYDIDAPKKLPENTIDLLMRKAALHAAQAFLMENLKAKAQWMATERNKQFTTELQAPEMPEYKEFIPTPEVSGEWALEQLSASEYNEYLEQEAIAAHIGQFIHQDGKLDKLRKALPSERELRFHKWTSGGTITEVPINVAVHHNEADLFKLHQDLSEKHRNAEKRVNYYKAKMLNLVNAKNTEIIRENKNGAAEVEKENALIRNQYNADYQAYIEALTAEKREFTASQLETVNEIAKLRIEVDPRFKLIIDEYSSLIPDTEAE